MVLLVALNAVLRCFFFHKAAFCCIVKACCLHGVAHCFTTVLMVLHIVLHGAAHLVLYGVALCFARWCANCFAWCWPIVLMV